MFEVSTAVVVGSERYSPPECLHWHQYESSSCRQMKVSEGKTKLGMIRRIMTAKSYHNRKFQIEIIKGIILKNPNNTPFDVTTAMDAKEKG